jgi:hypothetical protein
MMKLRFAKRQRWNRKKTPFSRRAELNVFLMFSLLFIIAGNHFIDLAAEYWRVMWVVSGLLAAAIIFFFKRSQCLGWLSPPVIYMVIFWLFHFGLIVPGAIAPGILFAFIPSYLRFFMWPEATIAVLASLLFIAAFSLGALRKRNGEKPPGTMTRSKAPELIMAGWVSLIVGFGLFAAFLLKFGITTFFISYEDFFFLSSSPTTSIFVITYGLILILIGGSSLRTFMVLGVTIYLPVFFIMMASGSRTGPLFSIVVLVLVMGLQGVRLPRLLLIGGAVLMLIMTATIRDYRLTGLGTTLRTYTSLSIGDPVEGMTELGGSLCPVIVTVDYLRENPLFYGETYLYPFYRQVARIVGKDPGSLTSDRRFIAQHITQIYGAIGYSTVAEAYANGRLIGVALFAVAWGMGLRFLMKKASSPYGMALLAVVLIPMMSNIRNSFIYVPAWIFVGALPLVILHVLRPKKNRRMLTLETDGKNLLSKSGLYRHKNKGCG